ncbi:MAG: leucine-rich repeat domain-containing protein [Muribaculaceae bacterium]|nr:leucine-rich repeat domain-containing protein [Muribaculaceae bacterium]
MAKVRGSVLTALLCGLLWAIFAVGCSDPAKPDNLEPTIELFDAAEITRTEAVISARVHVQGTGRLDYVTFHYGETGNISREANAEDADSPILICHLKDLKPGTAYSWYVVGGTSTATIRTETHTFTTVPNERPVVSPLVALSTGPVGLVAAFDIVDDGGERITSAGCEIQDKSTLAMSRVYLPPAALAQGKQRLHIGNLSLLSTYIITPFASNAIGESKGQSLEFTTRSSIVLGAAGELPALFEGSDRVDLETMTVSGPMDGDDFRFLRMLLGAPVQPGELSVKSAVTDADLADATIVEGGGPYDGSRYTVADEISTGLFADCVKLRDIALPATATVLARDAFARCTSLESLTLAAEITSVLPSAGCTSLNSIEVSAANGHYTAVDGVLFNKEVTGILWFPLGKTGAYALPPSVTAIGEDAFAGTGITSLEIPPSVTAIARGAFAGSSLMEIILPDNLTNISEGMFQGCAALAGVHLGAGTEYVGNYVFDGTALKDLYVAAPVPPFAAPEAFANRLSSITQGCTLHVPAGCRPVYRNHSVWGQFSSIVEF